jgi:hypothetical protein
MRSIFNLEKKKGIPMPATTVPIETLYRTSTLLESFSTLPPAAIHLRDRLFPKISTTESDLVSVETYRGRSKLSPFVSRYSKGHAVPRERTQISLFSPPFQKPMRILSSDELYNRHGDRNASTRDAELLTVDYEELDNAISRTENWMCSECLFAGKVTAKDGDTGEIVAEIDYGTISESITSKPWSDTTSNTLGDLKAAQGLVSGACGFSADIIIMGRDAGDAFESNPNVLEAYNKLFIQQGSIDLQTVSWGVTQLGTFRGVALVVDETVYEDAAGVLIPFVPPKVVLVAASGLAGSMAYAGVSQVNEDESGMAVVEGPRAARVSRKGRGLPQAAALISTCSCANGLGKLDRFDGSHLNLDFWLVGEQTFIVVVR